MKIIMQVCLQKIYNLLDSFLCFIDGKMPPFSKQTQTKRMKNENQVKIDDEQQTSRTFGKEQISSAV